MNLQYMEYFLRTADKQSITAAATDIFISPQGLNKALKKIEAEYGASLYELDGGKFCLTKVGEKAYEQFSRILELDKDLRKFVIESRSNVSEEAPKVTILCAPIFVDTMIPRITMALCKQSPHVRLRIIETPSPDRMSKIDMPDNTVCLFGVASGKLDAMCRKLPHLIERHVLYRTEVRGCISKKSPLRNVPILTVEHFADRDLVLCRHEEFFLNAIDLNYDPAFVAIRSENKVACFSVLEGNSKAIGFTNHLELFYYNTPQLISKPIAQKVEMLYGYLAGRSCEQSRTVRELISIIEAEFNKLKQAEKTIE